MQRLLHIIIDYNISAWAIPGGGIVVAIYGAWPPHPIAFLILGGALIILGLIAAMLRLAHVSITKISFAKLYNDRTNLYKNRRTLLDEIKKAKGKIWLLCHTASRISNDEIWSSNYIERLILFNPYAISQYRSFEIYPPVGVPISLNKSHAKIEEDIIYASKRSIENGIKVRWSNRVLENTFIIANPQDVDRKIGIATFTKGWVRIELTMPFSIKETRPNFLIEQYESPTFFNKMVKHYEEIWNDGVDVTQEMLERWYQLKKGAWNAKKTKEKIEDTKTKAEKVKKGRGT